MNPIQSLAQFDSNLFSPTQPPIELSPNLDPSQFAKTLSELASSELNSDDVRTAKEEAAYEAASQFVGMAFIQPMLAQMRESTFATERFGPTAAENRFGPMLDAELSDRITSASNFPLVDMVAEKLLGRQGVLA